MIIVFTLCSYCEGQMNSFIQRAGKSAGAGEHLGDVSSSVYCSGPLHLHALSAPTCLLNFPNRGNKGSHRTALGVGALVYGLPSQASHLYSCEGPGPHLPCLVSPEEMVGDILKAPLPILFL